MELAENELDRDVGVVPVATREGVRLVGQFNLPPESLTLSPPNPTTADNAITFTAVVKNIGLGIAGLSTLEFRVGGETPGASQTLFAVPGLVPGASFQVDREVTLTAQAYINTATADVNGVVLEANETNNVTTLNFFVTDALISVLVVERNDETTFRQDQLASKLVPSAGEGGETIADTGNFTLTSLGPTGLAALTCGQIQDFDVVYAPIASALDTTSRNAIKDNPAFAQCFASSERAVITGYHAEASVHDNDPATGQFLFDALTWIAGGTQVGLLVLNDVRLSPQKYDFLQPMFPGVFASVRNQVVGYQDITFLTTPPHPVHANTSDGVQNLGSPTMDNWGQTCHTIWNTLGLEGGRYEDDGFIAVSEGLGSGQGPHVCAIAKEGGS